MCALHVEHKKSGQEGHPIAHTLSENGDISHYTVEFDSVIVENIPVENLNIMQQESHQHKRDDVKPHDKKKPYLSEDELEEVDKDGDGAPAAPKWADQDDDDPNVGNSLEEEIINKVMEMLGNSK